MRGAIPPLPNMPSWRNAQFKRWDTFTFTSKVFSRCMTRNAEIPTLHQVRCVHSFLDDMPFVSSVVSQTKCRVNFQFSNGIVNEILIFKLEGPG